MGLIKQHLDRETKKEKKDLRLINELKKVIDRGTITFEQWYEPGRFINRDEFYGDNPKENLHVDCTDVVVYYGDLYIQVLKSGEYYIDPNNVSRNIGEIELALWDKNCGYLWG